MGGLLPQTLMGGGVGSGSPGYEGDFLLLEAGSSFLLLESGDKIILEA